MLGATMKRRILATAVTTVLLLTPATRARGPVYSYTDANGVVHFSNRPADSRYQKLSPSESDGRIEWVAGATQPGDIDRLIRLAAHENQVQPALVKAVIKAESNFDARATSRRGAKGLMQLMPKTARAMGAEDLHDPEENVRAGARYLRHMLDRYGDMRLALAAYNAGPTAVDRYRGVPPYRETRAYVKRVLNYYRRYHGELGR
jgi:soluble lytic murein transglycosylase